MEGTFPFLVLSVRSLSITHARLVTVAPLLHHNGNLTLPAYHTLDLAATKHIRTEVLDLDVSLTTRLAFSIILKL